MEKGEELRPFLLSEALHTYVVPLVQGFIDVLQCLLTAFGQPHQFFALIVLVDCARNLSGVFQTGQQFGHAAFVDLQTFAQRILIAAVQRRDHVQRERLNRNQIIFFQPLAHKALLAAADDTNRMNHSEVPLCCFSQRFFPLF